MKHEFLSGFADVIHEYLEHRALLGYSSDANESKLANFDRFCTNQFPNEHVLTKDIAFAWCNDANGNGGARRATILRGFARYIHLHEKEAYIIPPTFFCHKMHERKLPVIMNDAEMRNFFAATDRYPSSGQSPLLEYTVPVIFRLQYACGMRPQEVRNLRCVDFSLSNNTVYMSEGKHYKDRCLPINMDVMEICNKYNRIAENVIPNRTYFFQSPTGSAYTTEWLCKVFNLCWEMSGNAIGRGYCTPYALRHNFATQTLMRWVEEGISLDAMIPYLSAYMGHKKFSATYYYIHLLPERLGRMDFTRMDDIIPEVGDFEE